MKFLYKKISITLFFVWGFFSCNSIKKVSVEKGSLDLRNEKLASQILNLDGEWELYYNQLLTSEEIASKNILPDGYIKIPGSWKGLSIKNETISGTGYSTLRVRISAPSNITLGLKTGTIGTASKIYINGILVQEAGKVGKTEKECIPGFRKSVIQLPQTENNEYEIILHACNYSDPRGGVWESLEFGDLTSLIVKTRLNTYSDIFIASILFIMGIYHVILFTLRRKDFSPLFFGGFCLAIGIRVLLTSERILHNEFPHLSWNFLFGTEYAGFILAVPLFYNFTYSLYREDFSYKIAILTSAISFLFLMLIIFAPPIVYTSLGDYYRIYLLLLVIYSIYVMFRCLFKRREDSLIFFAGISIILFSAINDVLVALGILHTAYISGYGLFFFIMFQSTLIAIRFSRAFKKVEELYLKSEQLTTDLIETNFSISRFVPAQFMHFLQKDNIRNLNLGDFLKKEVTIFFSDIRGFTSLSENMESDEVFKFLNSYFHRTVSIINKNRGFVDKILGDGIMAIFPNSPQDAVNASLEIQSALKNWNEERLKYGLKEIKIGIGIHFGLVSIGAVGIEERLDTTIVGDPVNVASRLENMTKEYKEIILLSETVYERLSEVTKSLCREIGSTVIRGRNIPLKIYSIEINSDFKSQSY